MYATCCLVALSVFLLAYSFQQLNRDFKAIDTLKQAVIEAVCRGRSESVGSR